IFREGSKDVSGLLHAARYESQPFKADHRVAAPVREPVIAGKDRALFVAIGVRPRGILKAAGRMDNELIGCKYKIRAEGRERLVRLFDETLTPPAFGGERLGRRQGVNYPPILDGRNERNGNAYFEINAECPGTIQ